MSGLLGSGLLKGHPRNKLSEQGKVVQNGDSGGNYGNGEGRSVGDDGSRFLRGGQMLNSGLCCVPKTLSPHRRDSVRQINGEYSGYGI
jgi:hypothetical protein